MKNMILTMGLLLNYWVVVNEQENVSIVKIYDSNHQLVKESKVERKIDITKKSERRMLNKLAKR